MLSRKATHLFAAGGLVMAIALSGCSTGQASPASTATVAPSGPASSGGAAASGGAGNARSGSAEGGTAGTVESATTGSFTVSTATGETVTVNEAATTTYETGTSTVSANEVTVGTTVLVFGIVNSTTIAASEVIVQPTGDYGSAASSAAGVVPFQQGAPSTAKNVGQIPAYTEGSGTIVDGTTADQATQAALAAYPGGVVDRVVLLSGGDYEVHTIGVNWPHHVFVDQSFTVLGAN